MIEIPLLLFSIAFMEDLPYYIPPFYFNMKEVILLLSFGEKYLITL